METRAGSVRWFIVPALIASIALWTTFVAPKAHAGAQSKLLRLVNASRAKHDLRKLRIDASLTRDAMRHTRRMIGRNGIYDPRHLARMLNDEPWRSFGGSVVGCGGSLFQIHRALMRHTEHRVILLNRSIRRIGIGAIRVSTRNACGRGSWWITELVYG